MSNAWKFYKSNLDQSIPVKTFVQSELVDTSLNGVTTTHPSSTQQLQWKQGASVSSTKQLQWKQFASVNSTKQLQWHVGTSISSTQQLQWKQGTVVNTTKQLQWKQFKPVSSTQQLQWKQGTVVNTTKQIQWKQFTSIANTKTISWKTFIQVDTNLNNRKFYQSELFFNRNKTFYKSSLPFIGFLKNTLYWEISPLESHFTFSWKVGTIVNSSVPLSWSTGGKVSSTKQLKWSTGGKVSNVRSLYWGINGALDMAFGLQAYRFNAHRVPNNINYYNYRLISINNSSGSILSSGSTFEMVFDHASMVAAGESDEYGDQLRMTYVPLNGAEQELDIELINPNTSTTTFRFKSQSMLAIGVVTFNYRLYYNVVDLSRFEETFRDKKNVYYFYANSLSSNLALANGVFTTQNTGIQRLDDTNPASIGFNVPNNAEVEVEFRFLDSGASDTSRFIGIEWRGDGNTARTFKLDNNNGVTNNRISNYNNGSGFASLSSPVNNIKTISAIMKVQVIGSQVTLYLNGTLLSTVTDITASTGGMRITLPSGSEVMINSIVVSQPVSGYTINLNGPVENLKMVPASHKVILNNSTAQNVQCNVLRLKKQYDNTYSFESMYTIGESGDTIPATANQINGSIEIHMFNTDVKTHAMVMELST